MSDAAFSSAPFPAYTTAELRLAVLKHHEGRVILPAPTLAKMSAEIARRERVAAGDVSAMTPAERLRRIRKQESK